MNQVYSGELEAEFRQFQDWLKIFPLLKGKADEDDDEDEEERLMGKYKVGGRVHDRQRYVLEQLMVCSRTVNGMF